MSAVKRLLWLSAEYEDHTLDLDCVYAGITFPVGAALRVSGNINRSGSHAGSFTADIATDIGSVVTVSALTGISVANRLAFMARWDTWIKSLYPDVSITWQ